MKNMKKFLPITFLTLFVLAACTAPVADGPIGQSEVVQQPGQAQEDPTTLQEGPGPGDPFASRYGSGLKCDLLKTEQSRQNCEYQINDMIGSMLESEIMSSFDLSRCKELQGEAGNNCTTYLTEIGVKGPVSAEEMAMFQEAVQGTYPEPGENGDFSPFPEYDPKKCATLKTEGFKEYCEKQIAQQMDQIKFDEIISSGDVKRCDEFKDENSKNNCKMMFGVEIPQEETPAQETVVEPAETPPGAEVVAEPVDLAGAAPETEGVLEQTATVVITEAPAEPEEAPETE